MVTGLQLRAGCFSFCSSPHCILSSCKLLLIAYQSKPVVDTLIQYAAGYCVSLKYYYPVCSCFLSSPGSCQSSGTCSDDNNILHHFTSPENISLPVLRKVISSGFMPYSFTSISTILVRQ